MEGMDILQRSRGGIKCLKLLNKITGMPCLLLQCLMSLIKI